MDERILVICGAVAAFTGVALGAFGAHGLRSHFDGHPDLLPIYRTATEYQMYHALALLGVAWAAGRWSSAWIPWSGYLFIAGIILFSGSLYILAITTVRWWGAITPIGGVAFLLGWLSLAIGVGRGITASPP